MRKLTPMQKLTTDILNVKTKNDLEFELKEKLRTTIIKFVVEQNHKKKHLYE